MTNHVVSFVAYGWILSRIGLGKWKSSLVIQYQLWLTLRVEYLIQEIASVLKLSGKVMDGK